MDQIQPKLDAASILIANVRPGGGLINPRSFDYFNYDVPPFSLTALGTQTQTIQTFSDSYFVVKALAAVCYASGAVVTRNFTTQMYNGATGRLLNDAAVNFGNLWGSYGAAAYPNKLVDPIVLPPSSNLVLNLTDVSNNGTYTVQVSLGGYRHYDLGNPPRNMKAGARLEWYTFSASLSLSGNGGPTPVTTRIDADADFLVRKIVATSTGLFQGQVVEANSGEVWQKNFEAGQLFAGTAQFPNLLVKPRLVIRNSALLTYLQDLSGSTNAIQVVYEGAKVYR